MQSAVTDGRSNHQLPVHDRFKTLIQYAVMAPSGHNTQPWLFRLKENSLDLIADRNRRLPVVDPDDRELTISCGAALDHMQLSALNNGWALKLSITPEPGPSDVLANIEFSHRQAPDRNHRSCFCAIPHRRTTRANFEHVLVPADVGEKCIEIASRFDVELVLVSDLVKRTEISKLVAQGDQIQFANREFRQELSSWVRSRRNAARDGMSGTGFGMPDVLSPVGAMVIRHFDLGKSVAVGDHKKITAGSPTLAILCSSGDTVADWLAIGRALSRILLTLTTHGLTSSYLNPPVEVEILRPKLAEVAGCRGIPQLLLRIGYGPAVAPTVRRSVESVLLPCKEHLIDAPRTATMGMKKQVQR